MTTANFTDGVQFATVELSLGKTASVLQFNVAHDMSDTSDVFDADEGRKVTNLTATISAVQSGVIFASKMAGVRNILITVQCLRGHVGDEGFTGFAVAAAKEFLLQAKLETVLNDPNSEGWSLGFKG